MALSIKILSMEYLNHKSNIEISADDPTKDINNLDIKLTNNGETNTLEIKWSDCADIDWKRNYIVKGITSVPTTLFVDNLFASSIIKNQYSINSLKDVNIAENTLYCFRIFTEFSNDSDYYSGFKNIFFVYAFDESNNNEISTVIPAEMVLQNFMYRFVTDDQISAWNAKADSIPQITLNSDNIPMVDTENLFDSEYIGGALKELFTYANNGKISITEAITTKGVNASFNDTFSILASKILQIITGIGTIRVQENPIIFDITDKMSLNYSTILKFSSKNIQFFAEDSILFEPTTDVIYDGSARIITSKTIPMLKTTLDIGNMFSVVSPYGLTDSIQLTKVVYS